MLLNIPPGGKEIIDIFLKTDNCTSIYANQDDDIISDIIYCCGINVQISDIGDILTDMIISAMVFVASVFKKA